MNVGDIIRKKGGTVITIHEDATLKAAVSIMDIKDIGALVVLNRGDHLVGLLSERHVVRALAQHGYQALMHHVRDHMNRHVCVCAPADQLKQAAAWMIRHQTRYLPVVDGEHLAGIVSAGDVVKRRLTEIEEETHVLREIIMATHFS